MIKYAKILNEETGLCEVGLGTNAQFYQSIGMEELDVQQSDIDGCWYLVDKCPMKTDEEKELEERERIAKLKLTKREVFLGLYQAKGVTPEMIKAQITDAQALIEFEYANDYYRGNPLIDVVGATLGITPEQLDKFFETNNYTYLISEPVVDNSEPVDEENSVVTEIEPNEV